MRALVQSGVDFDDYTEMERLVFVAWSAKETQMADDRAAILLAATASTSDEAARLLRVLSDNTIVGAKKTREARDLELAEQVQAASKGDYNISVEGGTASLTIDP